MNTHYELLSLLPGTLSDEEVVEATTLIRTILEKHNVTIAKHGVWEKRKLAYPIDRIRQGIYVVTEFDMDSAELPPLERAIALDKAIVRHQLVKAHKKTAREIEQEAKYKAEDATRQRTVEPAKEKPVAVPMTTEKLSEKLEEILTDDMVQ